MIGLGIQWWSGAPTLSATVGVIAGLAAAFLVGAVGIAVGRSGERPRERRDRTGGGPDR